MPIDKDNDAERLVRLELFVAEMRPKVASLGLADRRLRRELSLHLDVLLDKLRGTPQRHRLGTTLMH
jgi:hypothetical protein